MPAVRRLSRFLCFRRLARSEYVVAISLGTSATLILWYRPSISPDLVTVAVALVYVRVLYWCGFLANAIGDRDLDRSYSNYKREIALAVDTVGLRVLERVLATLLLLAILLGVWTSWLISSSVPLIIGALGILAGIGYSLYPFRWKVRGFLSHSISLSLSIFFAPAFLLVGLLNRRFDLDISLLALGYALSHYGMAISNQLKDYEEDSRHGILTLPSRVHPISCAVGLALLGSGLILRWAMLAKVFQLTVWSTAIVGSVLGVAHIKQIKVYITALRHPRLILDFFRHLNYARWHTISLAGDLVAAVAIRLLA